MCTYECNIVLTFQQDMHRFERALQSCEVRVCSHLDVVKRTFFLNYMIGEGRRRELKALLESKL